MYTVFGALTSVIPRVPVWLFPPQSPTLVTVTVGVFVVATTISCKSTSVKVIVCEDADTVIVLAVPMTEERIRGLLRGSSCPAPPPSHEDDSATLKSLAIVKYVSDLSAL